MYIDSHAHLYFDRFDDDRDELIENLLNDEKIDNIINVATDLESCEKCIALSEKYKELYATSGFHPNALDLLKSIKELDIIKEFLKHEKVIAVGEIGLDYYWDIVDKEKQKKYFIRQLEIALEENYPVIIHNREADEDIFNIIKEVSNRYQGVFHCYAGSIDMAFKLIDMGFHISFTGNITYKKNDRREVIKELPLNKILLETDSPFLTPVPFRGKRNDSGKLKYIANEIALIKDISVEEVARVTSKNTKKLFSF